MAFPGEGLDLFYMEIFGGFGYDAACSSFLNLAAGIPQTGNPPYTVADFQGFYPQFFGPGTTVTGTITSGCAMNLDLSKRWTIHWEGKRHVASLALQRCGTPSRSNSCSSKVSAHAPQLQPH